jgi:pSer/pThr/pTyr-binding forkhead associated (FHA) protein
METIYAERRPVSGGSNPTFVAVGPSAGVESVLVSEFWVTDREFIFPLKVGINTMGRSAENDVMVDDLYVSRRHCIIMLHHNGTCEIYDTASKNGTYLNGARINGPTPLRPGDEIRICNKHYIFQSRNARSGDRNDSKTITGSV